MNISRSRAVDSFKEYGIFWYHSAQRLPIDIYKDIILFHEFVENVKQLVHTHRRTQSHLITIVQERHEAYQTQNYDHPLYGGFIDVMIRRKIGSDYVKSFLQAMLLNTTHISYQTEDELEAYIHGTSEVVWLMVSEIIGCAPSWYPHVQSLSEWIWFIHMILDLSTDWPSEKHYIPQVVLDKHHVSSQDIMLAIHSYRPNDAVRNLIKYYVDLHESMWAYAIKWIWYLNKAWHEWVLLMLNDYEHLVDVIKRHDYNVFHPRFRIGLWHTIVGRIIYWFWMAAWR